MQKTNTFFLSYIPGTIKAGKCELTEKCDHIDFSYELKELKDGLEVQMPLEQGCALNHYLKIPTRILLRIAFFKCRDLPKLFNKLLKIDWSPYICTDDVKFNISSNQSRLFDSSRIEKSAKEALKIYLRAQEPKKKYKEANIDIIHEIYIRFDHDECTVSLNTSGDRLDRRGRRVYTEKAPLRETLAATMVYESLINLKESDECFVEYDLIDPMCGSGVIPLEAQTFYKFNKRKFHYEFYPYFLKNGQKELLTLPCSQFRNIILKDIDEKSLTSAKANLGDLKGTFEQEDVLQLKDDYSTDKKIIITNPPYNRRLKTKNDFYNELIPMLRNNYNPKHITLLIPKEQFNQFQYKKDIKVKRELKNGGLSVLLLVLN